MRRSLPLFLALLSTAAAAQPSAWLPIAPEGNAVALNVRHGFFDDSGLSALSSAHSLEGRVRLSPTLTLVGDVPTAYASVEDSDASAFVLGNPYLALEAALPNPRGRASAGLGVRLPVLGTLIEPEGDDGLALFYGSLVSYDRLTAFATDALTLVGTAEGSLALSPEVALVGELSPQLAIRTDDEGGFSDPTELFASYVFRAEALAGPALLTAGIRGTGILSQDLDDGVDRFEHALGLAAEIEAGTVRPGLFLEVPINGDTGEFLDAVGGIGLSVDLD